jgi:hypothetical protein
VRYIDLPKRFIAGEVALADKPGECGSAITVQLKNGAATIECKTDNFGDFEFDGLKTSETYVIRIAHEGYEAVEKSVVTYSDVNAGLIELQPLNR